MKLKALAVGVALAFPMMAHAQADTSVTLYGTIDTGIEWVNNIGVNEDSSVHFTNLTSSWPSHWGLRGTEQLSENLQAVFNLEAGFNPGNGVSGQGGRLFGRQAWVGLKGDWGQIAFGRQYNMLFWGLLGADILGPNAHGLGSIDSYIPNARMDNSITYRGQWAGFKFGAAYARGRDTVATGGPAATNCGVNYTNQGDCRAYSAMLGYDAANWGVAAAYDVITGTDANPNFYALSGGDKDRRMMANAYVKFDAVKVGLIYLNRKNEGLNGVGGPGAAALGDRSDLWTLNAAWNLTPAVTLDGSVNWIKYKNADESSRSLYYVARAKYALSKRTSTYISAGYMQNKGLARLSAAGGTAGAGPTPGVNQTSVMVGVRHNF